MAAAAAAVEGDGYHNNSAPIGYSIGHVTEGLRFYWLLAPVPRSI